MQLTDRYSQQTGAVYLTAIQALVRLPMDQIRRDRRAGLKTAVFISGYEGSPLGGYDLALQRVAPLLAEHDIHFWPGLNEDLAATAIFGSQIRAVMGSSAYDGVVGIWYGKGPGVDRSGDAFRHGNLAGSPGHSAVLVLAGDDHACKSSSIPHQSDFSLMSAAIPVLYPGNTQEVLDYGLLGIALSRFTGAWCGMKLVTNVCDGGGVVTLDPERPQIQFPSGYQKRTDPRLWIPFTSAVEPEVNWRRLEAAKEFARLNGLNRWFGARENASIGIATAGKTYYDLMQALADLGIGAQELERLGIRIAKFGMTFPIEPVLAGEFACGLKKILVLEEKRSFLEMQLCEALYHGSQHPVVIGKTDESGRPLVPAAHELDPDVIARILSGVLKELDLPPSAPRRLSRLEEAVGRSKDPLPMRPPNFCPGCPHNRSTLLLDHQLAGGGIGCHGMSAMLADSNRGYRFCTHMGAEGVPWIGMAPFSERRHIVQNMGDGTYFHSGALAIAACIAAGVNITFKIMYNGHVAMTGGQQITGMLPVPALTRKLEAEGVKKTVVLTDEPARYADGAELAQNAEVRDRTAIAGTLAELEKIPGLTVIIYDQQCAAEKRRLRARGKQPEPVKRLVIHEEVCEGCGDCVAQSNCMSLHPVATPRGQKMRIHQPSCNKDYSCALGDCPAFLTVRIAEGTGLKRRLPLRLPETEAPEPRDPVRAGDGYRIVMPGIGGTGVVTVNALLANAASMDGLYAVTLDQTGLAQKGGAVVSHLILSERPVELAARTNAANADLILGFDLLGAAHPDNLKTADPERTAAVLNTHLTPTGDDIRKRRVPAGEERMLERIRSRTRPGRNIYVDATRLAEGLFGTHLAANIFLLGTAFQAGLIPLSARSIQEAIRLNGVDVERNLQVFLWGRKYYVDAAAVESLLPREPEAQPSRLDYAAELERYQNRRYARQFEAFLASVRERAPAIEAPVAHCLFKLMAYKDEYEVARLLTDADFERRILAMWEQPVALGYNLHPPLVRALGWKRKIELGPWFRAVLRLLASLRFVRGTWMDLFGWMPHRRLERSLIGWYRDLVEELLREMTPETEALGVEIAWLADQIRGYERIKEASIDRVKRLAQEKMAELRARKLQAVSS